MNLLLQDIRLGAESNEDLTVALLGATLTKMQYNGTNPSSQFYSPTLQNVMLEIDSRTHSRGLELFQNPIYKHITTITKIGNSVFTPTSYPNEKIWDRLNESEKQSMRELATLTHAIQKHYQAEANK